MQRTRTRMRGADGEGSNRDKECGDRRCGPRSPSARRGRATGHNKAFSVATSRTGDLGITTSRRTRARNRARLRGARLAYWRHDLAALRRNPGDARCLSCARRAPVTLAQTEEGQPITRTHAHADCYCGNRLAAYLGGAALRGDPKGPLFRTIGRGTGMLTRTVLPQANAYAMIRRRAVAAGIATKLGNHSFRATGITVYLKNGGTLEKAAAMANHASTRTTQLYDRRRDELSLDEVERIVI